MKKKLFSLLLLFTLLLGISQPTNAQEPIKIWLNGEYLKTDVEPYIENNRTLVPVRVISENFGYEVLWDENSQKITIQDAEVHLELTIGITIAKGKSIDNKTLLLNLDEPAQIKNNRTFVPIRFIAEQFGVNVDWDGENRTVVIGDGYTKPTK
ncbi:Copper amine oxidase N-terminal domain-containing protein [Anaerosphaera aminiphila DSM 21120]|uniref:Copper amine oxidase N-terminal domain-containing protein n=1 Tax=Anaerosphaera aminiphila DSM 21120 TaxID=1120995 RepID=A0A1M5RP98_9FIRM|nr:copper amine oxidase N-terminal domain-containing protein [Anaerosphaera aminiphila]SHH28124.1 Copper amine oxidase N-terminal domain-containing protein [Anaerosphaera aminiphila DSM 21120]